MTTPSFARNHLSSIVLLILVAILPLVIFLETKHGSEWTNRLATPNIVNEPNRHTPIMSAGTFLPPTIDKSLTLTPKDNPVILSRTTTITKSGSLTIEKGVIVVVHEYGQLIVDGKLTMNGVDKDLVTFSSNESHPANKVWSGIILNPTSTGAIQYAHFEYASPAITCMNTQPISLSHVTMAYGATEIFNPQGSCKLVN